MPDRHRNMGGMPDPIPLRRPKKCPICGRPATEKKFRPFCSRRCADIDLNRWLTGAYAIPAEAVDEEAGEAPPPGEEED